MDIYMKIAERHETCVLFNKNSNQNESVKIFYIFIYIYIFDKLIYD